MAAHETSDRTSLPRLVPAKQAARETGISYGSLRDIAHRGEIPVVRVGRAWYFDSADLTDWISTRKERA